MVLPIPPLTLATIRDIFIEEILPPIRKGGLEQGVLDRALLTGLDKALGESAARTSVHADTPIEDSIALDLSSHLSHLTDGARALVRASETLDKAILTILADKGIKAYLRSDIKMEFKVKRLNQLLMHLQSPEKALADAKARETKPRIAMPLSRQIAATLAASSAKIGRPATKAHPSAAVGQSPALPTKAATLSVNARTSLAPYLAQVFNYQWSKNPYPCTVEGLIASLETYNSALQARVRAAMNGLFRSDLRFLLIYVSDLADSGDMLLDPSALALTKIFAIRLYAQLNAMESAETLARALRGTAHLFEALPDGEKRRLDNELARCALRSGRAREALQIYREIAVQYPDNPGALVNYIGSVYTEDLPEALSYAKLILLNEYAVSDEDLIFLGDLLTHNNQIEYALSAFYRILQRRPDYADAYLGLANIALVQGRSDKWSEWLKKFGQFHSLSVADAADQENLAPFRFRSQGHSSRTGSPKVSVIMTSFNSSKTLAKALDSVLRQSVTNLEIFIVDDQSTDDSREVIKSLAATDSRIQYVFNDRNIGTYASKNQAILQSTGQFVTFHDSDDWMHPLRIETQLDAMKNPKIMCSTSNWIRMDERGRTIVRRHGPYTHLNPASTFFRRDVFTQLGLFDNVRTGADSEILTRIRHRFGHSVVLELNAVLAIGLHHEASLTQSGATAFDEHRYSPVRLAYTEAWVKWHLSTLNADQSLLTLNTEAERPFSIPDSIAP